MQLRAACVLRTKPGRQVDGCDEAEPPAVHYLAACKTLGMPIGFSIYAVDLSPGSSDVTVHSRTCRLMPEKRESVRLNIECPSSAPVGATTAR